eukprot:gene112-72_t
MHTASVGLNGELYCWGKADSGQIGFSTWYLDFVPAVYYPKEVPGLPYPAIDVACGSFYTLVLTTRNVVYAMGKEDYGCLGTGVEITNMAIGVETPTLKKVNYMRVEKENMVDLDWGPNRPDLSQSLSPLQLTTFASVVLFKINVGRDITGNFFKGGAGMKVSQVSAGGAHTLVLAEYEDEDSADFAHVVKVYQDTLESRK